MEHSSLPVAVLAITVMASDGGKFDLVVLGATGFTGLHVVEYMARRDELEPGQWAIAGRNSARLERCLLEASLNSGRDLKDVKTIVADVSDKSSLLAMCGQARVLINCVGPYRFYGMQVVEACVEAGCHYVDISGEPQFLERVQLEMNERARDAGVMIVGSCGFDSIPADMGVAFALQQLGDELTGIEAYFQLSMSSGKMPGFHFATWQSAVHGFANRGELTAIRRKLFPEHLLRKPTSLPRRSAIFFNTELQTWCAPFAGSDGSVVSRSLRYFTEDDDAPPSADGQRKRAFPWIFSLGSASHQGPTREEMRETNFRLTMHCYGQAKRLSRNIVVSGPEPGYIATPICVVEAALSLILDSENLPSSGGGVFTPASAFRRTTLIDRLDRNGIKFVCQ